MKRFFAISAACLFFASAFAKPISYGREEKSQSARMLMLDTSLIDIPTAGVLDYYGLEVRSRFFTGGGVMFGLSFGVLPRLDLGISTLVEHFIGSDDNLRFVRPELEAKFRIFDGKEILPALSMGYDGQGYFYDRDKKEYFHKRRGLYFVGSKEVFIPGLMFHGGINFGDFEKGPGVFAGGNWIIEDTFALMAEWDNIRTGETARINLGSRLYITPFFHIDLALRGIGQNETLPDGGKYRTERIVGLKYNTSF